MPGQERAICSTGIAPGHRVHRRHVLDLSTILRQLEHIRNAYGLVATLGKAPKPAASRRNGDDMEALKRIVQEGTENYLGKHNITSAGIS